MDNITKQRWRQLSRALRNNRYLFAFERFCQPLMDEPITTLQRYAQLLGVPPQYWNSKFQMCAALYPRMNDMATTQSVRCDNDDETSLLGYAWNEVPDFLKYVYRYGGKNYCYHLGDLARIIDETQRGESVMDPYRRFTLTPSIVQDIKERIEFLRQVLEVQRIADLSDTATSFVQRVGREPILSGANEDYLKLVDLISLVPFPSITVDTLWNARDFQYVDSMFNFMVNPEVMGAAVLDYTQELREAYEQQDTPRRALKFLMNHLKAIYDATLQYDNGDLFRVALDNLLAYVKRRVDTAENVDEEDEIMTESSVGTSLPGSEDLEMNEIDELTMRPLVAASTRQYDDEDINIFIDNIATQSGVQNSRILDSIRNVYRAFYSSLITIFNELGITIPAGAVLQRMSELPSSQQLISEFYTIFRHYLVGHAPQYASLSESLNRLSSLPQFLNVFNQLVTLDLMQEVTKENLKEDIIELLQRYAVR